MIDLQDKNICPTLEDLGEYIRNPLFVQFCSEIKSRYQCNEKIEYSACSMEKGWNVKFKKAGKALCNIYRQTREGNGQRWLMIDLEDQAGLYDDVLRLIEIRKNS